MLKELLERYASVYPEEAVYKQQMLDLLNYAENCYDRSCLVGHFTGSAFLLNKAHDKALLMHHTKLDQWLQLGGHCDGDVDVLGVSIKEAQEESGINGIESLSHEIFDLDVHLIPQVKDIAPHFHFDVRFLLHVVSDEDVVQNRESKALKWFSKDEEIPTDKRSVTRLFEKWRKMDLTKGQ